MDLTEEQVQNLEDVFRQNLPPDQNTLTLKEFKKFMPSKNVRNRLRLNDFYLLLSKKNLVQDITFHLDIFC